MKDNPPQLFSLPLGRALAHGIADFCRRWKITELALFGSALRDDFRADSEIDLLARFAPDAEWSLLDHVRMERELTELFGRKVDLVSRAAVEASPNWIRRNEILSTARTLYAAKHEPGDSDDSEPNR